jgi:hypothetical protein
MATLRREDERWLPCAEKPEVVCEVYDMKFILGGVLEYRNADCRLHHIHEHDVTSSLKGKKKGRGCS